LRKRSVGRLIPSSHFHSHRIDRPKRTPHGKNDARGDPQCGLSHHCHISAGNFAVAQFGREKRKDSSSAGRTRSKDRRRKRLQKPLFFTLECYFRFGPGITARSSGLNLVRWRLFKIARKPSANASLESAQAEPAAQMGAAEKSKGPRRHIQGAFATRA